MLELKSLVKAGVHFGHQVAKWNPKMSPYVWGIKNNIHLIDVSKTAWKLDRAAKFLEDIVAEGKSILWVGTKKQAQSSILKAGTDLKMSYVQHRWIGGTLTNYYQVRKSITKLLHLEEILNKSDSSLYTKKELSVLNKSYERLNKSVGGLRNLAWPIGAVVLVDACKENSALKEAKFAGVPVIAIVDTNSDPSMVDYVIPANDDSVRSVSLIINALIDAAARGKESLRSSKALKKETKDAKKDLKAEDVKVIEKDLQSSEIVVEDDEDNEKTLIKKTESSKKIIKKMPKKDEEGALENKKKAKAPVKARKIASTKRVISSSVGLEKEKPKTKKTSISTKKN